MYIVQVLKIVRTLIVFLSQNFQAIGYISLSPTIWVWKIIYNAMRLFLKDI